MNILICGASGLVGEELCSLLKKNKISFYGTYNHNKVLGDNMFRLDFSNTRQIRSFMIEKNIKVCIFTIVQRVTDVCEKQWDYIKNINIDFVDTTSKICHEFDIKFIHLSTDYVFDGSKQPNYPTDMKNPLQNYGISKLMSELKVIKNCNNFCIIRTPVLYSSKSKLHNNAITILGKTIMNLTLKYYKEDHLNVRRPVYVSDLCNFIFECCYKRNGIYHFYNPINKFTKYEITKYISEYLEIDATHIIPNNDIDRNCASRPYDTQLIDDKYSIHDYTFTNFNKTIEVCFEKFKHASITRENNDNFLFLIDLDDTIINSGKSHYESYLSAFVKNDIEFITFEQWEDIKNNGNIDDYMKSIDLTDIQIQKIKKEKMKALKTESISFNKNSDIFIEFLIDMNIKFCVVTNTNNATVDIFKSKLPLLNKIKHWICRDEYNKPKPDPECYYMAKEGLYNGEKYIIGIEDTLIGYQSLKHITDKIFIINNQDVFKKNDCYLFNDFLDLIKYFSQ